MSAAICPSLHGQLVIDSRQGYDITMSGALPCAINLPWNGDNRAWFLRTVVLLATPDQIFYVIGGDEPANSAARITKILQNDGYKLATPLGAWNNVVAMKCTCDLPTGVPTAQPTDLPTDQRNADPVPPPDAPALPVIDGGEQEHHKEYLGFMTAGWQVGLFWAGVAIASIVFLAVCCIGCFLGLMYLK